MRSRWNTTERLSIYAQCNFGRCLNSDVTIFEHLEKTQHRLERTEGKNITETRKTLNLHKLQAVF
jgi:hypothetical protein